MTGPESLAGLPEAEVERRLNGEVDPACTCAYYVVDHSDPEPWHPENVDREDAPACRVHGAGRSAAGVELCFLADAVALRAHLDALNDHGIDFRAAGMDSRGAPFLIALSGPYAESEQVFYGSPWDSEVDWGTGRWCAECNAANPHSIESLAFPVVVLTRMADQSEEDTDA